MDADIPDFDVKHLLDHALDAVWVIDQDSTITFVNPVAEALTGYPVAELLGKPLSMILPKEYAGAHAGYVTGYLRRGRKPKVLDKVREFNILTRSGDLVPIELKAFELRSTDGRLRFGAIMRDVSERKALEEEQKQLLKRLAELALVDELTGLPNRRAFFDAMGRLTSAVRRYGEPASVAVMDIDHFKRINDTFGHAAGDEVLRTVARICTKNFRPDDTIGRIGGEEFGVLLPRLKPDEALAVIDRARARLGGTSTQLPGKVSITVTLSAGVAWIEPGLPPGDLLKQADAALYEAKLAGRNRALSIRSKGRPACPQARHH